MAMLQERASDFLAGLVMVLYPSFQDNDGGGLDDATFPGHGKVSFNLEAYTDIGHCWGRK